MSKMSNWVLEMQEDAGWMTLSEFIKRHGYANAEVWYDLNFGDDRDREPQEVEYFYGS